METPTGDMLRELARVLHWLGRYRESNVVGQLAVLCDLKGVLRDEALAKWQRELVQCGPFAAKDTQPGVAGLEPENTAGEQG